MRSTFLPFSPPLLGQEEFDEVLDTLRSDWITTGPKVKRFEQEFAQFIGAPAALAVSSATDAMLVGLYQHHFPCRKSCASNAQNSTPQPNSWDADEHGIRVQASSRLMQLLWSNTVRRPCN